MASRQRLVSAFCNILLAQQQRPQCYSSLLQQQQPRKWPTQAVQDISSSAGTSSLFPRVAQQFRNFAAGGGARHNPARAAARTGQTAAAGSGSAGKAAAGPSSAGKAAAGAAAGAAGSSSQLSGFQRWWRDFQRVPPTPKWLGMFGAIPFIALAPPVCKHLSPFLPTLVSDNCAMIQVCYGVVIVTFLGAVHWGVALATPLTSPIAYQLANAAYVYSVLPSLVAWPVALMEPGAGSMMLCVLLPTCYVADYLRRNLLPTWYVALRLPLTVLATWGMLLTATRYLHAELDKIDNIKQQQQQGAAEQA